MKKLSMRSSKPKLSEEQAAVLRAVLKGQSIFFTGSAGNRDRMGWRLRVALGWHGGAGNPDFAYCPGTGKSYLLKHILGSLPPTGTVATASTGVAACHIGGTTLHAFAGKCEPMGKEGEIKGAGVSAKTE